MHNRDPKTGYQTVKMMQYTVPITTQAVFLIKGHHRARNWQLTRHEAALKGTQGHIETTFSFCTREGPTDSCTPSLVLKLRRPSFVAALCYSHLHSRQGDAQPHVLTSVARVLWGIHEEAATLGSQGL